MDKKIDDLKLIKKHYGEEFMHLCKKMFPSLLEEPGLLYSIISSRFEPSKMLYDDIRSCTSNFKDYIYSIIDQKEKKEKFDTDCTPFELMKKAGYDLYECKDEFDIQSFRHYFYRKHPVAPYTGGTPKESKGEELCTFSGGRLDSNYVFFAVKDNVDEIKREDFKSPIREDQYGTSVISIQIVKDESHTLSIKNRYNHTVLNPDSTFFNNLDNIILGLTDSFEKYMCFSINSVGGSDFNLDNYVKAIDGKFYKFSYKKNNIYYCVNNIIIDNFKVKRYDKSKYLLFENMILKLNNPKSIECYDGSTNFITGLFSDGISKIYIDTKDNNYKNIKIIDKKGIECKLLITSLGHLISFELDKKNKLDLNSKSNSDNSLPFKDLVSLKNFCFPENFEGDLDLTNLENIENVVFPKRIKGSLNLPNLTNLSNVVLPEIIDGNLNLNKVTSIKDTKFPEKIEKNLNLERILYAKDLELPRYVGGDLNFDFLTNADNVIFPEILGGSLYLDKLVSGKEIKLPKFVGVNLNINSLKDLKIVKLPDNIGGSLNLESLTTIENFDFPEYVGGDLVLNNLTTLENSKLPKKVGRDLLLNKLNTVKYIIFPENVGGSMHLDSLTSGKNIILPKIVGEDLYLNKMSSAKDITLSNTVGGSLYLNSLMTSDGLVLPEDIKASLYLPNLFYIRNMIFSKKIGKDLILNRLTSAEDVIFPENVGGNVDLSYLSTGKGIILPKNINGNLNLKSLISGKGITFPNIIGGILNLDSILSGKDLRLSKFIKRISINKNIKKFNSIKNLNILKSLKFYSKKLALVLKPMASKKTTVVSFR